MRNLDALIPRRQPEPVVHRTIAEVEEEWNREAEAYANELRPGPLHLQGEKTHPLVRTEMRRTANRRALMRVACALVPPAYFYVCLYGVLDSPGGARGHRQMACAFICLWPALMFGASALSAAMAVISDRARGTAAQIVLTPVSGQAIAAARILPWPGPFVLGLLAALPLYVWAGGWQLFCLERVMLTPLTFLPMRALAVAAVPMGTQSSMLSAGGALCGLFMLACDVGLVWAAAHWGAAYAVWLGNLPGVMLFLLWRLFYLSVVFVAWTIPTFLCLGISGLNPRSLDSGAFAMLLLMPACYLLVLVWLFSVGGAVRTALVEFLRYDRLAGDDFSAGYFKRFRLKVRSEGPPRL